MAWFEAENPVLFNLLAHAISGGDDESVWQLVWTLAPFLYRRGRWHECIGIQRLVAARRPAAGQPVGLGHAHYELGRGLVNIGDFADAEPHLSRALDIFGQLGDRANEATVHQGFGHLFEQQGRYAQSLVHAREALRVVRRRSARPRPWPASRTASAGCTPTSASSGSTGLCQRSLKFQREIGHRAGEDTWDSLGYTRHRMNDYAQAAECYSQAVEAFHEIGDPYTAGSHIGLGDARRYARRRDHGPEKLGAGPGHPGEHPASGRRAGPGTAQ